MAVLFVLQAEGVPVQTVPDQAHPAAAEQLAADTRFEQGDGVPLHEALEEQPFAAEHCCALRLEHAVAVCCPCRL